MLIRVGPIFNFYKIGIRRYTYITSELFMYRYFIIKLKDIKQLKLNRRDWKHEETYNFMGVPLLLPDLLFDDT